MLAVNVGFLTLPGVMFPITEDTFKSVHHEIMLPSSSQIASTLSLEASIGSILIGLFLVRHNRTKQELDPTDAVSGYCTLHVCRSEFWAGDISTPELS
jgi:hypothetical protein